MIQEIKLDGLNNEPVKTNKKTPPMNINKDLPPCYFTSIFLLVLKVQVKRILQLSY